MPRVLIVIIAIVAAGCSNGSPIAPLDFSNFVPRSELILNCAPEGQDVVCTAYKNIAGSPDVTATARWIAEPADVATVVAPGRFRPLKEGELTVRVQAVDADLAHTPPTFLVGPGTNARPSTKVHVVVQEARDVFISGAFVEVLDGSRAGTTCTAGGGICTFTSIPVGEGMTVRVSKQGYQTVTASLTLEDLMYTNVLFVTLPRQ